MPVAPRRSHDQPADAPPSDLGPTSGRVGFIDKPFVAREIVKAPEIIDYTRRDNVAERLVKRFGAAMGEGAWKAIRSSSVIR